MKRHRFVGIILTNPKGEVLLQLRRKDETYYPSYWTLPGGMIEEEESPEQALRREVKEELGIDLRNYVLFKIVVEKNRNKIIERHIYWSNISEGIDNLKLGEGAALKYFSSEKISVLKIAFRLKPVIEEFLKT